MELFDKPLKDLTVADLKHRLQDGQVREGFFVDYKVQITDELWKTVSSFTNTYGGFVFIGIGEDEKTKLPISFDGVSSDKSTLEQVRAKVEGNVHPFPSMEIVPVPCDASDKVIIIIRVFESFATPHICGNGVIYQRNGDASSPVKDRHDLDRLYGKGVTHRADRRKRLEDTVTRRHIYGSCEWGRNAVANRLAICVLVMPEFIGNDPVLPNEIEQKSVLREMGEHGESRRLRDGTASIYRNDNQGQTHQWNWWESRKVSIVYRDGMLEFIKQTSGAQAQSFSASDYSLFITGYCSTAGRHFKDRLRPGNQTHLEVHILGAWGRHFFDDGVRKRSCQCDHGIIRLEYDVDLGDDRALGTVAMRAIDDVMSECGGAYRE